MSAYICSIEQFKILAIYAASFSDGSYRVRPDYHVSNPNGVWTTTTLASVYADRLYQENIRSVRCRYPDDKWDDLPGPTVKPLRCVVSAKDVKLPRVSAVQILKFANCINYQSCETEDWATTQAYKLLQDIKEAAIREVPGYAEAAWEYHSLEEVRE
jgi:hypothetical protein